MVKDNKEGEGRHQGQDKVQNVVSSKPLGHTLTRRVQAKCQARSLRRRQWQSGSPIARMNTRRLMEFRARVWLRSRDCRSGDTSYRGRALQSLTRACQFSETMRRPEKAKRDCPRGSPAKVEGSRGTLGPAGGPLTQNLMYLYIYSTTR